MPHVERHAGAHRLRRRIHRGVIFRGWSVVAGTFAVTLAGFGSAYAFSAFVGSLDKAFHASRGSLPPVVSPAGFLYFALGVVSGPLADRWSAR
jgi:hypothetical protein